MEKENKTTPMMQQWSDCKRKSKGALLFFRLGDFYEAFYEDAEIISQELGLTFTKRQNIPMCGVPYHTCDNYIDKLIAKGFKVAIAEQTEDPKKAKGLVKRELARIVTPGTIINSNLISDKSNNYFASICQVGSSYGLSFIDLTTSEFKVLEVDSQKDLLNELFRLKPKEFLITKNFYEKNSKIFEELLFSYNFLLNKKDNWQFDHKFSYETLIDHFKILSLDGFGLRGEISGITAAGALINHLKDDLNLNLDHIKSISTEKFSKFLNLDQSCLKNLEIFETTSYNKKNTLLHLLDKTLTPMGARLLSKWVKYPLIDVLEIKRRQNSISEFLKNFEHFIKAKDILKNIRDLERLNMKISSNYATPRDFLSLKQSLFNAFELKENFQNFSSELILENVQKIKDLRDLAEMIDNAVSEDASIKMTDGKIFKNGYNEDLDEIRQISKNSKEWIANYQNKLREEFKIKTLKVGFTRVFGYYIEVSKGQSEKFQSNNFTRRQTLVNAERYISEDLKTFEQKVFTAEDKIKAIEIELFNDLREKVSKYFDDILIIAKSIAQIDAIYSLSKVARENDYILPEINNSNILDIKAGRHPLIEKTLKTSEFIPNDTLLDNENNNLFIITGPNMAGKSTYIRQVAIIVIMAQMGSFVPAKSATIGIVDKVFSRIGASDDLSRGQSTFMVEMTETANILNNATDKSLIILDEIGRGTSTYDGISIAWAVAEYLLTTKNKKAKTLFATHYWELTALEKQIKGAVNYNISVAETDHGIVFLRKIIKGDTDKSYGIHVANLAGLPHEALKIAKKRLEELEKNQSRNNFSKKRSSKKIKKDLLDNFPLLNVQNQSHNNMLEIIEEIKNIDLNNLTPLDAQQKIYEFQKKILLKESNKNFIT